MRSKRSVARPADPAEAIGRRYRSEGLTSATVREFRRLIRGHYRAKGRSQPWRDTDDPYRILVSEVMLQQTQVGRVAEKYGAFLAAFPDVAALGRTPLRRVLALWQGLGYNRRAVALHRLAQEVVRSHGGVIPHDEQALIRLPGIGRYTANAVRAFAFRIPTVFIETNIRRVFLHVFFRDATDVDDSRLMPLIERTLDRKDPRSWYYGLMDYGSELGKLAENPNRRSRQYTRQTAFEGSRRQQRARVLRAALAGHAATLSEIAEKTGIARGTVRELCNELAREGFLRKKGRGYSVG